MNVRIPEFIAKVAEGDFQAAYEIITSTNALPAICGRVCPQESQCESKCVRGIKGEPVAIGRLERFVADWYREHVQRHAREGPPPTAHKVAVVGSGPAGLTCACGPCQEGLCRHRIRGASTPPAACWYMAFRNSVCPRPLWPTRSKSWRPWAWRS